MAVAAAILPAAVLLVACGTPTLPFVPTPAPTPVPPREVRIEVVSSAGEVPLADALLSVDGQDVALTGADGSATMTLLRGTTVRASADGHDPNGGAVPDEGPLRIVLRNNVASGTVSDASGAPVAGVRVFVPDGDGPMAVTDARGAYRLPGVPDGTTLVFKMPGYRLTEVPAEGSLDIDVSLQPFSARALYAPAAVFETPGRLEAMLDLIDRTEVNAMVIDVKETDGRLYYATDLPEAAAVGAIRDAPIFDLDQLLLMLHQRGIYAIARMVVMKDNTLAVARPDMAVRNVATGEAWRDNIGGAWLDPAAPGVAEYAAAIAGDLADRGFDEVQLDYIRFYSDGPYDLAETNLPNTQSFRLPAIGRVLRVVSAELERKRAFLAADVFPIAFIVPDDQGIGQRPEVIMPYVDYFSPMVYPSHYGPGVFGFPVPNQHPYEVIDETLKRMNVQAEGLPMVIRPWIQDFGYGPFPPYTADQVRAEFAAAADNGAQGWMIWNARAVFTEAALGPPREDETVGPSPSPADSASGSPSSPPPAGPAAPTASP